MVITSRVLILTSDLERWNRKFEKKDGMKMRKSRNETAIRFEAGDVAVEIVIKVQKDLNLLRGQCYQAIYYDYWIKEEEVLEYLVPLGHGVRPYIKDIGDFL